MNKHQKNHFVGNIIVFEVTHDPAEPGQEEVKKAEIVRAVGTFLFREDYTPPDGNDKPPADSHWKNRLHPPTQDSRIITFQTAENAFSLVPLKLRGHIKEDRTPNDVLNLLNDAYTELESDFINPEQQGEGKFQTISLYVNNPESEFQLKSISPDWLASDLHHGKATGGPGSLPARKPAPTGTQHKFKLKGSDTLNSLLSFRQPGAQVAILDTVRPLTDFPAHLNAIFSPPNMEIINQTHQDALAKEEWDSMGIYTQYPHHYLMPDHGPFVASIVRFIAPTARIKMYEVLTQFGIGSFTTVAQGVLDAIRQRDPTISLIISCSFMLDDNLGDLTNKMTKLKEPPIKYLLGMSMKDVFYWATKENSNVTVVASAGNDAKAYPRHPAAFEDVLSVAAIPKSYPKNSDGTYKRASYSNCAHYNNATKDKAFSFATFGGDLVNGSLDPSGGVLGAYIGVIPTQNNDGTFFQEGSGNPTGYVHWSGTSFATPIVTGLIAAQDSDLAYSTPNIPGPHKTRDGENVILVQQG